MLLLTAPFHSWRCNSHLERCKGAIVRENKAWDLCFGSDFQPPSVPHLARGLSGSLEQEMSQSVLGLSWEQQRNLQRHCKDLWLYSHLGFMGKKSRALDFNFCGSEQHFPVVTEPGRFVFLLPALNKSHLLLKISTHDICSLFYNLAFASRNQGSCGSCHSCHCVKTLRINGFGNHLLIPVLQIIKHLLMILWFHMVENCILTPALLWLCIMKSIINTQKSKKHW